MRASQFGAVQIVAPALGVQLTPVDVRDAGEIERAVAAFARRSNGGVIVTAGALATTHRQLIIDPRHRAFGDAIAVFAHER
jgi:putative tryptophan/tyrosine transport system substrate-binding protein